ncbi:MAG: Y-family DNA polymerase [Panacagrimonas sp.]
MLWLCLHFPRLPLSALGLDTGTDAGTDADPDPVSGAVVVDQQGAQRWLITGTADCAAGTPFLRAASLHPGLRFKVRRPAAEQAVLRSLACWIYRYGQPVTADIRDLREPGRAPQALLWVEIGHSLALFGGLPALLDQVRAELPELGHAARLAVAPTRAAAALLACAGRPEPVLRAQDLPAQLHELPLSCLHWPDPILGALAGVGLRRLGELFAIPRAAFVSRFGAEWRIALDRLVGAASDPFEAIVPPETFHRRFELAAEVEAVESLHFPLKRLCTELQAYLRARDRGLRSVTLAVRHAGARETRIHAQFVDPHRDAGRFFNALRERLERDGLPLAARELLLLGEDFADAVVPQGDLFDPRAGQAQAWAAVIERIRARLGHDNVWTPRALEDHRPEHATHRHDPGAPWHAPFRPGRQDAHRPTFLLPRPCPMPAPQLPPGTVFERIESGWWDDGEICRDYLTLDLHGGRAWVFRDAATQAWFLHGWWS